MNFNLKKLCFAEARAPGIVNKMLKAMLEFRYNQRILKQCLNSDITKEVMFKYNLFTYENISLSQKRVYLISS